jgi:hypothetical protein
MKRKPAFLINTLDPKTLFKGFTLVLCFSRRWCVAPFFERFKKLKFDRKNCHLLVFDNTDNILLQNEMLPYVQNIIKQYLSVRYLKTYRQGGSVIRGEVNNNFYKSKIFPISQMQFDISELVTTKTFVQLEDDELPQNPYTISKLLNFLSREGVGLATGVSAARSPLHSSVGMGVHDIVEMQGDRITKRICSWPDVKGVKKVMATGFYCFATYTELWRKCLSDAKNVASGLPHWAFDTWVTNRIIKRGYKLLADFSLWCDHIQAHPDKLYYFNQKDAVIDCYVYIPELKVYAYWQNSAAYGWLITRKNKGRVSSEILRR